MLHWTAMTALGYGFGRNRHYSSKSASAGIWIQKIALSLQVFSLPHIQPSNKEHPRPMPKVNRKFTIGMRRHLIACSIDMIERGVGLTKHHHSRLNSEANRIMDCEVLFDCDSPMEIKTSTKSKTLPELGDSALTTQLNLPSSLKY